MTDVDDSNGDEALLSDASTTSRDWLAGWLQRDPRFDEGKDDKLPSDVSTRVAIRPKRARPFRREEHDAVTRRSLAFIVLGIVILFYGAAIVGMLFHLISMEELSRVALVLGPIQALAAAVLGFYFGQDKGR